MKNWHLDLIIENAEESQAGAVFDEIIELIDSKGMSATGGIHLFGDVGNEECQTCSKIHYLPKGNFAIESPIELKPEEELIGKGGES